MSHSSAGLTTFKYRLYPSKTQERRLLLLLEVARHWYNMCVGERKWAYELEGRSVGKYEQLAQVRHYRAQGGRTSGSTTVGCAALTQAAVE